MCSNLEKFKDELTSILKAIISDRDEIKNECNQIKQELFILRQEKNENSKQIKNIETAVTSIQHKLPSISINEAQHKKRDQQPPQPVPVIPQPSPVSIPQVSEPAIVSVVGDSIINSLDTKVISAAMNAKVVVDRAYTSLNDTKENEAQNASKLPDRSYENIVDSIMTHHNSDVLILQAGAADITNFKTAGSNIDIHREYLKQQTVVSARNLFTLAENALKKFPSLREVIILKQVPRYDPKSVDPLGLKAVFSQLFNDTLVESRSSSSLKSKISV